MPTVPRVQGPSVNVAPIPNARVTTQATPESMGAGLGRGLAQLGGTLGNIGADLYQREQEKANAAAVLEARRQLGDWERQWFDPTNTNGVYANKGRDALKLPDAIGQDFQKIAGTIRQGLGNDRQRLAFDQLAMQYRDSVLDRTMNYAAGENEKYQKAEFEASLSNSAEMAADAARSGDMARATKEVAFAQQVLRQQAAINGESPEVTKAREADLMSQVHLSALNGMLTDGKYAQAETYWKANAEDMTEQDRSRIDGSMRQAILTQQSIDRSAELIARHGAGQAAIKAAREIEDPVLRERVENRIDAEISRRNALEARYEKATRETAWSKLEQAPAGTSPYDVLTPQELAVLSRDPGALSSMERRAKEKLKGTEPDTNPAVFNELQVQAYSDPKAFAARDLTKDFGSLAFSDREHFARMQADIKKPSKPADLTELQTASGQANDALKALGIDPNGKSDTDAKRAGAFRQQFQQQLSAFETDKGGKATFDERQKILDRMTMKVFIDRPAWFDAERPSFELTPEDAERAYVPLDKVPPGSQQAIQNLAKSYGKTLTATEIGRAYVLSLQGDDAGLRKLLGAPTASGAK